jgi:N-acylmannosamine kinase
VSLLVVDIGGTKVSSAWWERGQLREVRSRPMARDEAGFVALLQDLHRDYPHARQLGVAVTGRAVAGVVRAVNAAMIGFWNGYPLAARMAGVGLPAPLLLNDAQAAAWGEFRADVDVADGRPSSEGRGGGAGDEAADTGRDLLFVTLSTGVGGGLVLGGRLQSGGAGLAGHIGHVGSARRAVDGDQACSCGRRNCLETVASGTALARQGHHVLGRDCTAQEVLARAKSGDVAMQQVVDVAAAAVAQALADASALTGVARVRLGGGLGLAPVMFDAIERALRELPPLFVPVLEPACLGAHGGLIGVGWWAVAPSGDDAREPSDVQ